jgi:HK97 family phage portal protein
MKTSTSLTKLSKKISTLQKSNRQLRTSLKNISKATESRHFGTGYNSYSREDAFRPVSAEDYMMLFENYTHVFACVNVIAQNLAKLPLRLYNLNSKSATSDKRGDEVTDGPMWSLINRPNPMMTGYGLIYSMVAFLKLTGNYFGEKVGSNSAEPVELWTLRPDWMRILPDPVKMISGYEYYVDGSVIKYTTEEILRIKAWHPRSELYGLGIISPAANSIITDLYAMQYSKSFFKQGGHLDWYMTAKEEISDESFKRLQQEIRTKFSGMSNAHAPAVLDSGLEIKELGGSPDRNVLLPQKTLSRDEVCEAFGVPALMLGLPNETHYNNADAQYLYFWEQTEQPVGREIEDTLNRDIFWPMNMECAFDYSQVKVLKPNTSVIMTSAKTAVDGKFMTPNEVRELVLKDVFPSLEKLPDGDTFPQAASPFGGGNVGNFGNNAPSESAIPQLGKSVGVSIDTVLKLIEHVKGGIGSGHVGHYPAIEGRGSSKAITKEVIDEIEKDVIHGRFLDAFDKLRMHGLSTEDVNSIMEAARKRSRLDEHLNTHGIRTKKIDLIKKGQVIAHRETLLKTVYPKILKVIGDHYTEYGEAVLKVVNGVSKIAFVKKDMVSEAIKSLDPVTKKMAQELLKMQKSLINPIIKAEFERAKSSQIDPDTLTQISDKVGEQISKRIDKSMGYVSDTAKSRVEKHLTDLLASDADTATIAKDIEGLFFGAGEEYAGQAQAIARTESLKFTESARFDALSGMGFDEKEWFESGHEHPREDHAAIDGEVVKMGDPFSVKDDTGYELMFPGDPNAGPDAIMNCGCTFAEHVAAAVDEG